MIFGCFGWFLFVSTFFFHLLPNSIENSNHVSNLVIRLICTFREGCLLQANGTLKAQIAGRTVKHVQTIECKFWSFLILLLALLCSLRCFSVPAFLPPFWPHTGGNARHVLALESKKPDIFDFSLCIFEKRVFFRSTLTVFCIWVLSDLIKPMLWICSVHFVYFSGFFCTAVFQHSRPACEGVLAFILSFSPLFSGIRSAHTLEMRLLFIRLVILHFISSYLCLSVCWSGCCCFIGKNDFTRIPHAIFRLFIQNVLLVGFRGLRSNLKMEKHKDQEKCRECFFFRLFPCLVSSCASDFV